MTWLLIALFIVAVVGVGWCCLAVSGDAAQREEDRYGDEARRS